MKQKIKKLSYKIPLKGKYFKNGNIEVPTFDIPGRYSQEPDIISIKVRVDDNILRDNSLDEQTIWIPKQRIKALRKALKKILKNS